MAVLPATGSAIVMGRVKAAYTNVAAAGGQNIALSGTMASYVGQSASTQISLSSRFGGQVSPYAY